MSNNSKNCAVILAGGQGKRMKSDLPKPMFEVLGLPMLDWAIRACEDSRSVQTAMCLSLTETLPLSTRIPY